MSGPRQQGVTLFDVRCGSSGAERLTALRRGLAEEESAITVRGQLEQGASKGVRASRLHERGVQALTGCRRDATDGRGHDRQTEGHRLH